MNYNFEWDTAKALSNLKKHGIRFEEAAEVFLDPLHLSIPDEKYREEEERWITLRNTQKQKCCLVVHTFMIHNNDPSRIRIISARPATRHEQKQYEEA